MPQIIRPFQLSCNPRVLEHDRKFYYTLSCTLGFDLLTQEIYLEFDYLFDCIACMGAMPIPDPGLPKPNAEYLVSAKFFAPQGKEVQGGKASIQFGESKKEVYVFGNRRWGSFGIGEPERMTEMPIDYQHAFGGEGFEINPQGIGFDAEFLPNVENPKQLISAKGDRPQPVSFSPLDTMSPFRAKYRGNYDNYLEKAFPGYPQSTDWKFFLTAFEDQWIEGFYRGDEAYLIENMHPLHTTIEGKLPNVQARCFLKHQIGHHLEHNKGKHLEPEFIEKKLNLDTVWFFPEKLKGMLIWRGVVAINDDEGNEISDVLLAYENRSDPQRDVSYYQSALTRRHEAPEDKLLNHFKTLDLIPLGHICAIDILTESANNAEESALSANINAKVETLQADIEAEKQQVIQQFEEMKNRDDLPPEALTEIQKAQELLAGNATAAKDEEMEQLMAEMDKILPTISKGKIDFKEFSFKKIDEVTALTNAFLEKKKAEVTTMAEEAKASAIENLQKQKENPDLPPAGIAQIDENIALLTEPPPKMQPLPRINKKTLYEPLLEAQHSTEEEINRLKQQVHLENPYNEMLLQQIATLKTVIKDAEIQVERAVQGFRKVYSQGAHFQEEGLPPQEESTEKIHSALMAKVATKESLADGDYAGLDLAGANLDGMDFSNSLMEQVNLYGASLRGANLSHCVLVRANLENADFTGANLEGANIGATHANKANFTDANLHSTILARGNFTDATFTRCNMEKVDIMQANFQSATFSEMELRQVTWFENNLQQTSFPKLNAIYNIFYDCNFDHANLAHAVFTSCAFVKCHFDRTGFMESNLEKSCFVGEEIYFHQNKFSKGKFNQTNFLGMPLQGADFSESDIENALFNDADLSDSNFSYANARTAQFRKAKLTNATFDHVQLWEGSLAKAHLVGTSFIGANLAYTDFLRATFGNTNFRDANLDQTLIQDWRPS